MVSYITLLLYVVLAEVGRRFCMALLTAFTGPLAKIPGPFLNKMTALPSLYQVIFVSYLIRIPC